MSEIAFRRFHQVRDQVVTAFELHIDLRVGVLITIAQGNQGVVSADDEDHQNNGDQDDESARKHEHEITFLLQVAHP